MVDAFSRLPFFTAHDTQLLRADTGRDPLGLLPIWGEFGRKLVPVIAGPVTNLDGVKAVLLIYYTYDILFSSPDPKQPAVPLRRHFRLMEGLLESYLYADNRHCYGSRILGSEDFSVRHNDKATAVNGLYQYYRGTCNRAGLLEDGALSPEATLALHECWDEDANRPLAEELQACALNAERSLYPKDLLDHNSAIRRSLDNCYASPVLNELLFNCLFGDPHHRALAAHCATLRAPSKDAKEDFGYIRNLVLRLNNKLADSGPEDRAKTLIKQVKYLEKCEPFLTTVQDCFDYLRNNSGISLDKLAKQLTGYEQLIRNRASDFRQLDEVAKSARSRQMLGVALTAQAGLEAFLNAILDHHTAVAEERGRDPMVRCESAIVLSLSESERDVTGIIKRLENGYPWDNGYYLSTAGNLYEQAKKGLPCLKNN